MKNTNYKLIAWAAAIGMVGLVVCYVLEFDHFGNTMDFGRLLAGSLAVGLLAGVWLGLRFQKKGEEQVDKIRIWAACLLLPLVFAPWLGSLTNRALSFSDVEKKPFDLVEEVPFAASAYGFLKGETVEESGCYLFVYYKGGLHRLKRKACVFFEKNEGDTIYLPVKKGLWGSEVVMREW